MEWSWGGGPAWARSNIARFNRTLHAPRDPFLVDAGRGGELLVARIRLRLLLFLLLIQFIPNADPVNWRVSFSFTLAGLSWAALTRVVVARHYRTWMGWVSSLVDVSLVSVGLCLFLVVGHPFTAVNSKVFFEVYFLAIGCTSLRYDWRICAVAGTVAVGQYLAIVVYTTTGYDLATPQQSFLEDVNYGPFSWNIQAGRIVLLVAAAALSAAIVTKSQQLRRLSAYDRLTGIHNRGTFDENLVSECDRADRYGRTLTVAMVDIDEFKRFNDVHGHHVGDEALRRVAHTLRESLRASDMVARYGGEEFGLLLPETSAEDAMSRLDSLRGRIAAIPLRVGPGRTERLTVSIGVASWPADGRAVHEVLRAADERLYRAKAKGRNRVVGPSREA